MKLNPEVYRYAAELVDSEEYVFSCIAVKAAVRRIVGRDHPFDLLEAINKYMNQYMAFFGPYYKPVIINDKILTWNNSLYMDHPFWDKENHPSYKNQRVIALLLMAEIVENGMLL